jgi:hypothetical protein
MLELSSLAVGDKVRLVGNVTAEVLEIVNDEWAKVQVIEAPSGQAGGEELCHATDIIEVVSV